MQIKLRFFASVRETLDVSQEQVSVPPEVSTIGQLRAYLIARGGVWAEGLAPTRALRTAYNQLMCGPDVRLTDGCEIAFFPPVTGG
jgi:molybdopterin synthase sulfur carrier subunit